MYQINDRFFIGLLIVAAIAALSGFTKNLFIVITVFVILIGAYLAFFFLGLKNLNEVVKENEKFFEQHKGQEYVDLTREEARQMKKEGGFEKNGKFMIDEEYSKWQENQRVLKDSQRLQSQAEKNLKS